MSERLQGGGPFRDVHPSETGRRPMGSLAGIDLPQEAVKKSRHNESRWIRCRQCGFPVDTERDLTGSERDGVVIVSKVQTAAGQADKTVQDPEVHHGCPHCGADEGCLGQDT
jgi:hypothetical protein